VAETVFVRKATGLVRDVGIWSALFFNIGMISAVQCTQFVIWYYIGYGNGGNFMLGVLIGGLAALAVNVVWAQFSAAMPRSGGEYVFLGRTMNPLLGYSVNFVMMCCYMFWWVFDVIFQADMVIQFGHSLFFVPVESLAWIGTPMGIFAVGFVLMLINVLISLVGFRLYLPIQNIVYALVIISVPITAYYFLAATGNFPAIFNAWALKYVPTEPDMYHKIISDGLAAGWAPLGPEGPLLEQTLVLAAIFFTMLSPYGIVTTYISGEIKKADSVMRQHFFAISTVIFGVVVFLLMGWTWLNMAGLEFVSAVGTVGGWMPSSTTEGLPLNTMYWSFAQIALPYWAQLLFGVGIFLEYAIVCEVGKIISISRCILAWSFDRVFPTRFAHVSDRFKSPTYAIVAEFILALIFLSMAVSVNVWLYIAAASFWIIINCVVVCVAGIVFPYLRKDMYEVMPLKARIAGIPVLSIVSFIGVVLVAWTSLVYAINPSFAASFGLQPVVIGTSIFVYVLPVVIFFVSRRYWKAKGIELDLAFKQIPPA
jgi:APA family basic amino acid/polyamine antiporter